MIPTIVVKIDNWLVELEGVMATIEDASAAAMDEIKESDEWKAAVAACTAAKEFQESQ